MTCSTPSSVPSMTHAMPAQRRNDRRRPLDAPVGIFSPYAGSGVAINASRHGLRVAVDCVLAVDDICMLRIDHADEPPQLVRARVAWTRQCGDGCIAGLEIIPIN